MRFTRTYVCILAEPFDCTQYSVERKKNEKEKRFLVLSEKGKRVEIKESPRIDALLKRPTETLRRRALTTILCLIVR